MLRIIEKGRSRRTGPAFLGLPDTGSAPDRYARFTFQNSGPLASSLPVRLVR
jgi:hypothetical protein